MPSIEKVQTRSVEGNTRTENRITFSSNEDYSLDKILEKLSGIEDKTLPQIRCLSILRWLISASNETHRRKTEHISSKLVHFDAICEFLRIIPRDLQKLEDFLDKAISMIASQLAWQEIRKHLLNVTLDEQAKDQHTKFQIPVGLKFPTAKLTLVKAGTPTPVFIRHVRQPQLEELLKNTEYQDSLVFFNRSTLQGDDILFLIAQTRDKAVAGISRNLIILGAQNLKMSCERTEKKDCNTQTEIKGLGSAFLWYRLMVAQALGFLNEATGTALENIYASVMNVYRTKAGLPSYLIPNIPSLDAGLDHVNGIDGLQILNHGTQTYSPTILWDPPQSEAGNSIFDQDGIPYLDALALGPIHMVNMGLVGLR